MFEKFFASRKSVFLVLGGVIVLALLSWRVIAVVQALSKTAEEPVLKIRYCGAEPEELCVLSFGRDMDDKFVVNLFVPEGDFPQFYVKIERAAGEGVYECVRNEEVQTSVYCLGDMVGLLEKMEVNLYSLGDDHLFAAGNFTLEAVLVFSQSLAGGGAEESGTPTPAALAADQALSTGSLEKAAPTPTLLPSPSYPNPSYP
ncbi:MAG: hypothetical protein HYZ21_07900 [Chloroflexi bacterium]|nr:hypothetical protein [Chloroflexota bacterium]